MNIHGSKKQKGQARKPTIATDNLVATSYAQILYGLCEGEIAGLADDGKSIRLENTPLINDNGEPNFEGVSWEFRTGTLDQTHIAGFPSVENEHNIGVELRHDRDWTRQINNRELSAVRVRLNFNALKEQKENGDITGYAISYAIDVQTDGGSFVEVLTDTVRGKASQGYKKAHRIDLPNAGTAKRWTIRVRRITPNRDSELVADTMSIDALTEIIDAKLSYPCTALLGISYDAKTFNNIAKIAVRLKGKIIQVPSNYNAETRQYNGLWDGSFKFAYSNNPAWVFYDLCTHKRYGLGERLSGMVDKWRLYQIGQYCDELVDDGKGGQEPRFTCNVYIQKADDAYRVLQNLASVFRGLSFWDGQNIVVDSDTPKDPVYTFSPANVVGGEFSYTGTRARDRHTLSKVAWDNPENNFTTEYELIPDEEAIAKYGVRTLDISAFGCTSKGQAQRAGIWALKAEQLQTQTVTFKTGLQGFIPQVGQVINIADNVFAGRAISGRIVNVNGKQITLDRVAGKIGDILTVATADGIVSSQITAAQGEILTLKQALNVANESIWAIISDDLKLKQFRILTIAQNDDATFDITALEYNRQKYAVVDNGAMVTQEPFTVLKVATISAPKSVALTAHTRTHQGQAVTTLNIAWEQVSGAVAYIVEWRKDDGNWQTLPKVSGQSVDIDGVYAGAYQAKVRAIDAFDNESLATSSQLTQITGKQGKPPRPINLSVQGVLFGMNLGWNFARGSDDTNYTEIEVSPDGRSNIATLGTFAYPTNKHEITGLQGNLRQFYRARIVDKLGNTSDWTDWASGTTSANADKVLDMLSGQISQSHLDQSLRTPIGKIGTIESNISGINSKIPSIESNIGVINSKIPSINKIPSIESAINSVNSKIPSIESAVNSVNGNLSTLNSQLATAQNELSTAKSTLQIVVGNITTERNRITAAIFDINALQADKNAKTQEIANLTQTVGSHTSSIRELGVATGDLSQKYNQIKTQADNTNSEITAIKQTQSGQATSVERLGARFDNLSAGGRNLIINSGVVVQNDSYPIRSYPLAPNHGLADGDDVVITIWGQLADSKTAFYAYNSGGWVRLGRFSKISDGVYVLKTPWAVSLGVNTASNTALNIYPFPQSQTGESRIDKIKLERGNIATDWTAAPEDLQEQLTAQLANKASTASVNSLTESLANKEQALSRRIGTVESSVSGNTSSINTLNQSLTDKERALTRKQEQLTAQLANKASSADLQSVQQTLTTKEQALTEQINTAKSELGGRITQISDETRTLSDANRTIGERINRLDSEIYSPNLLRDGDTPKTSSNWSLDFPITESLQAGRRVYISLNGASGLTSVAVYNSSPAGAAKVGDLTNDGGVWRGEFDWVSYGNNNVLQFYREPRSSAQTVTASLTTSNGSKIANLERTLTTKEQALSERINTVESSVSGNTSSINTLNQSLTTTERALTTKQEQLTAQLANKASTSSVNSLSESLASKERALSRRIGTVESSVSGNTSSINTLNQSLTDKERALTRKQEQLTAQLANKASTSSVNSLSESLASKERALTEQINRAKSEMGGRITQISDETRTLADANRTIGERINQLNSELAGTDSISDNLLINSNRTLVTGAYLIATYRISKTLKNGDKVRLTVNAPQLGSRRIGFMAYNSNSASGSKLSDIRNRQGNSYTAEFEWNVGTGANNELWLYHNAENTRSVSTVASVSLQKITTSSGLASIKSSVANLERTLTTTNQSLAERINTVQTTLNGQTASIQQHAQSLNGLSAQWTLKVQSGGVVSGIGLASNNGVSDFAVRADKFYVASPQGDKKPMFSVITRPTSINGTTVPAGVYLNGDLLASGTISGDKIRANTQITAPNIRGGSISIGSNFSVDSQGNLNANSGVFRGQVFADKITGQIDVESLKSSAVALGYDMFISNSYHASSPSGFDKTFKASYPSHGSIIQSLGFNNENIGSAMYEMRVFCKRAITVKQKLHTVDDNLYCYVNGDSAFGYHSNYDYYDNEERVPTPFGRGRINTEISLSLRQGLNTIQFVLNNSGGGICQLIVLGDFIDNNIIKFA